MKIIAMDMRPYTHIHMAFGHVTTSYAIHVSPIQIQWELFRRMSGFKKIRSLGGWSFFAEPETYFIFRDAVRPENQDTFVANIVSFVLRYNLDGIDIDWECELIMFIVVTLILRFPIVSPFHFFTPFYPSLNPPPILPPFLVPPSPPPSLSHFQDPF